MSHEKVISLQELYSLVEEELSSVKSLIGYDKDKKEELIKSRKKEQELKLSSTGGCEESRGYILNRISVLDSMKDKINPRLILTASFLNTISTISAISIPVLIKTLLELR